MCFISTFALVLTLPLAHAGGAAELGSWVRSAGMRPEAPARVLTWSEDDQAPSEDFATRYPAWVQARIAAAVDRRLSTAATACGPSVEVGFVEPGAVGVSEAERSFEQSTFMVETLHCLEHGDAVRAMEVYNSVTFREEVMPGLESFSREGDMVHLVTGSVIGIVDRTDIRLVSRVYEAEGVRAFHTRLVDSADAPEAQGVFLRESVVAFVDRAAGGVAVYRIVYTRSKDMGTVQRTVLPRLAGGSQDKIAEALEEQLR